MNKLPPELALVVFEHLVVGLYDDKNKLLELRTTCKLFDELIRPLALRTLQLEFTRLDKTERSQRPPDQHALQRIGHLCEALYLDTMVLRDNDEVSCLGHLFSNVDHLEDFVTMLRDRYCMNGKSFTTTQYRSQLASMLEHAPNITAVRVNLPFQLLSQHSRAGTMILSNTLDLIAKRPEEETRPLKTLVIDNLTSTSVVHLWRNPQDVKSIIHVFRNLNHLCLSVRRHTENAGGLAHFGYRLWEMIAKASGLETLCIVGLDLDEKDRRPIRTSTAQHLSLGPWRVRTMPMGAKPIGVVPPSITCLELRSVEIHPLSLVGLLQDLNSSLKELYLNQVYLKSCISPGQQARSLWVGLPNQKPPEHPDDHHMWIAIKLRQMENKLRVCRATNLGYDQFTEEEDPDTSRNYDFIDPCGLSRTLEHRFVEVVMGYKQPAAPDGSPVEYWPDHDAQVEAFADKQRPARTWLRDYDTTNYFATERNPTSSWQKSIDGHFPNCNQTTLERLHQFADEAFQGMREVNRAREENALQRMMAIDDDSEGV